MEVKYWEGGLEAHEVEAIEKIKDAFSVRKPKKQKKLGLKDLRVLKNRVGHNWKAFAGFRFVNNKGKEGEFDLLIFTHCNILVVELKDWHYHKIVSKGVNWFHGKEDRGASPVGITRRKKELIEGKILKLKNKVASKPYLPHVKHLVVITGDSDFSGVNNDDKPYTLSLEAFLELSDEKTFNNFFRPHPKSKTLQQDIHLFENLLFGEAKTETRSFSINGWQSKEVIFEHPQSVYKEYLALDDVSKKDEALIRRWNFDKLNSCASKTPDGRLRIVSREREVLHHIKIEKHDLYKHCLNSLTIPQKEKITTHYAEVYELPPGHKRFNDFIGRFGPNLSESDRITLVKLIVSKFADLHAIKVAHRDLGDHSIWISPGKEVALSNFISAYYQPLGTVGEEREGLSVNVDYAPLGMKVTKLTTPFQIDIYSLGLIAWHIIQGKRLSPNSIKYVQEDIDSCDDWYASVLKAALDGESYRYAEDFFDQLMTNEPKAVKDIQFDLVALDAYRQDINHSREYRDDTFLKETSSKEVYVSKGRLVKAWLNINPIDMSAGLGHKLHYFLQRLEKLRLVAPGYLPRIENFGIANKSSSLFTVSEYIPGTNWSDLKLDERTKFDVINQLISAVEHYHSLTFAHGDLHPGNVRISQHSDELELYLIDTPDFCLDNDTSHNTRYSPENVNGCSNFERDNFAVMRMAAELLDLEWEGESSRYPAIASVVKTEASDLEYGFKTLDRFKEAIKAPHSNGDSAIDIINVTLKSRDGFKPVTLYPDNGQLFVQIDQNSQNERDAIVQFTGIGGRLKMFYSRANNELTTGIVPREIRGFGRKIRDDAQLTLPFAIRVSEGSVQNLSALNERLMEDDSFQRAVGNFFYKEKEAKSADSLLKNVKQEQTSLADEGKKIDISTKSLWQAIIDTELESHPYISVAGDVFEPIEHPGQLIIPYEAEKDALDGFNKNDTISAIQVVDEQEKKLGEVDLRTSSLQEIRLTKLSNSAKKLREGDIVFFRSEADKSSYKKRRNALERILNGESVINSLVYLFDPLCVENPVDYGIKVTDEDFARYDRQDEQGNLIRLNDKQRSAFQRLVNTGPLSMLQGPPGTGKTEFIAAFVHYLIEKQGVNNILLVSQSHEAVNTAAKRIREHCNRLDTCLEMVRFSNNESKVSDGLKDVYSQAIVNEKRELFKAEFKYRVKALASPLGLDSDYLGKLVDLECGLLSHIRALQLVVKQVEDKNRDPDESKTLRHQANQLQTTVITLLNQFAPSLVFITDLERLIAQVMRKLEYEFAVRPDEAKKAKALMKISRDMIDVLGAERTNYDEFFARSRQLVAGTCVGIGQRHIGIAENQYDWVIIDEAARSISSELAIAMQSGKRVLLVGDHQQLPPLYTEPHKKALARRLGLAAQDNDIDDLIASDFERAFESAYGKKAGAQLLMQYRMAKPIGNMVSSCFYDKKLQSGKRTIPSIYGDVPSALKSTVTWLDTASLGKQAYHRKDKGASIYCPAEAEQVITLLENISKNTDFVDALKKETKEGEAAIGVICMYAEQKRILRQKFKSGKWSDTFKELVRIDTVDSYQGKENRVIILSITRSIADQSPGFLRSPNRINVALSRAMDRLIIVGNSEMWRGKNMNLPLGRVYSYIKARIDGVNFQRIVIKPKQGKR